MADSLLLAMDLPQVWQQPSYEVLLATLQSLELQPPSWHPLSPTRRGRRGSSAHHDGHVGLAPRQHKAADLTRYLTGIIKSSLSWLGDEACREQVWEQASRRVAERCGRTALGDLVRRWRLAGTEGEGGEPAVELLVREPALTGDALGLKTWASSYALALHLPRLEGLLPAERRVLELGAGTGLLGLAAAVAWRAEVVMSDLPAIVPNLRHNVERNAEVVAERGGSLAVGALTWGGEGDEEVDPELFRTAHQFPIVLAADPLYDDDHPALLAGAIRRQLALSRHARAIIAVPRRDATTERLLAALRQAMRAPQPLVCVAEDELEGRDDWGEDEEEGGTVRCWLGVFSWAEEDGYPDAGLQERGAE